MEITAEPARLVSPIARVASRLLRCLPLLVLFLARAASTEEADPASSTAPVAVVLARVELEGATVLDARSRADLVAPWLGRPVTTADLLDLADRVRQRYAEAGYVGAEVALPDQDLTGGELRLRVEEGSVEAIEIRGAVAHWPAYLRGRLARATRSPLHVPTLYRALERLQAEPGIEKLSAVLERVGPGRQRLVVEVKERSPWSASVRFSNHRSPSVGSPGGLFSVGHSSLFGLGDRFMVQGQVSEGIRDFALRWDTPLVFVPTRAFVAYRRGVAEIVEGDFQGADVRGRYESISVGLHQPVYGSPRLEASFDVFGDWRRGGSQLLGVDYCFQADLVDCKPTVAALRIAQELIHRGRSRAAALRSTLSIGVDALGATEEKRTRDRDGEFVSWLLQLQWLERLPEVARLPFFDDTELAGRFDLQLANDPLVAVEQFAVGGGTSVRGYRENQFVRDQGFVASIELRLPLVRSRFGNPVVSLAPFFDVGRGWDRRRTHSPDKTIPSIGTALRFAIGPSLRADVSWAHRLRNAEPKASGLQGDGVYFEVVWDVF